MSVAPSAGFVYTWGMRLKWKLLLAFLIAIAAYYWGWWIILVFGGVLFGMNGSRWLQVNYIPRDGDQGVTYYFKQDGESYRNSKGETHQMVERGKDTWASDTNWNGGKR